MKNTEYKIYCDLDGTVSDFDKKVLEITNGKSSSKFTDDKRTLWSKIGFYDKTVQPFFESLEKMDDADLLVHFIVDNFEHKAFLTATGYTPKNAAEQKHKWTKNHYGELLECICVTKSPEKAKYASPKSILIDDRSKSIDPWVAAGGIGILHTDAESTIKKLKEIVGMD